MPRYLVELEVAGARFAGSQWQPHERTIQGEAETAVARLAGGHRWVRPASRLDAGVDAERLPADFELPRVWDPATLCIALSDHLPCDIAARRAAEVPDGFSAVRDARRKDYRYRVFVGLVKPVLDRRCLWIRGLDFPERLSACVPHIIGRHDLSGFATLRHDERDDHDPVRTVLAASWTDDGGGWWTFRITGEGFLYRQVRGLVGGMVAVARNRRQVSDFAACAAGGRSAPRVGNVAPAEGLTLERVYYEPEPEWKTP